MNDDKKPFNMAEHERRALRAWTAAHEMLNGTAGRAEWDDLADCINIVEALHDMGKLPAETMHWVVGAIDGMTFAVKNPNGQMRMHATQMVCLRNVITIYDESVGKFSRGTILDAQKRVVAKIALSRMDPNSDLVVIDH
jgi:hypothetical protein